MTMTSEPACRREGLQPATTACSRRSWETNDRFSSSSRPTRLDSLTLVEVQRSTRSSRPSTYSFFRRRLSCADTLFFIFRRTRLRWRCSDWREEGREGDHCQTGRPGCLSP